MTDDTSFCRVKALQGLGEGDVHPSSRALPEPNARGSAPDRRLSSLAGLAVAREDDVRSGRPGLGRHGVGQVEPALGGDTLEHVPFTTEQHEAIGLLERFEPLGQPPAVRHRYRAVRTAMHDEQRRVQIRGPAKRGARRRESFVLALEYKAEALRNGGAQ